MDESVSQSLLKVLEQFANLRTDEAVEAIVTAKEGNLEDLENQLLKNYNPTQFYRKSSSQYYDLPENLSFTTSHGQMNHELQYSPADTTCISFLYNPGLLKGPPGFEMNGFAKTNMNMVESFLEYLTEYPSASENFSPNFGFCEDLSDNANVVLQQEHLNRQPFPFNKNQIILPSSNEYKAFEGGATFLFDKFWINPNHLWPTSASCHEGEGDFNLNLYCDEENEKSNLNSNAADSAEDSVFNINFQLTNPWERSMSTMEFENNELSKSISEVFNEEYNAN